MKYVNSSTVDLLMNIKQSFILPNEIKYQNNLMSNVKAHVNKSLIMIYKSRHCLYLQYILESYNYVKIINCTYLQIIHIVLQVL